MIELYTRKKICEVIDNAYPDEAEKLKDFYIEFNFKEQKASWSSYVFHKKRINVNTLSRTSGDIFLSCLKEIAKHIDIKFRRKTIEDLTYYKVLRKLLSSSLKLHIIEIKDLQNSKNDKLKEKLQQHFGSFSKWNDSIETPEEKIDIYVFDAFMLKNMLKLNKFIYDPDQQCWLKTITKDEFDSTELFINTYNQFARFVLINDNRYYIEPVYLLKVISYSKEDAKLFRSYSYEFDKKKHYWFKTVPARIINDEIKLIEDVPKQRISIGRNRN